ncbi:MAG: methyltransferase domain-containing protein, partial [Bdellovibrionales bacterium]|nr:methyltransferase domain-containing protein [Bdellovibrionales bacterium]
RFLFEVGGFGMGKTAKKRAKTGLADGYIHGFTQAEQDRLFKQARIHEEVIFSKVDFSHCKDLIEIGSGVGAQTKILLERNPDAKIVCVDAADAQVARAKKALAPELASGRVQIDHGDALHLKYADSSFDGAFICWLLEHVQNPIEILEEARRVLRSGGVIYCNEVFNASFYVHPYSPATLKYWMEFNDHQWSLKGDPFVGGKLANYLMAAGYQTISTHVLTHQYDNRTPKKRAAFLDYWTGLLLSGADTLIGAGRITKKTADDMQKEMQALKSDPDSVIFYSWILARAEAW